MKTQVIVLISVFAFLTVTLIDTAVLADVPTVPSGHPRVYMRPNDVNDIRAKIRLPEFSKDMRRVRSQAKKFSVPAAFVYLIDGKVNAGKFAITKALADLKSPYSNSSGRQLHAPFHRGAMVYDWCYDLMTTRQKNDLIARLQAVANHGAPKYPADYSSNSGVIVGHMSEGWVMTGQLPAGVAIYDEAPNMYDAAAPLFFDKMVPPRNFSYPGHGHHQGDSYISRHLHDLCAAWLFRRMDAGDIFTDEMKYVPYQTIYNTRADKQQIRRSDTYDHSGSSGSKGPIFDLTAAYWQDPYMVTMADDTWYNNYDSNYQYIPRVLNIIFRPPGLASRPISELPKTKFFPDPTGEMVARTGWTIGKKNVSEALMYMRIGGIFYHNHARRDMGTFQIYYKGPLAISSGLYQSKDPRYPTTYGSDHWNGYYHQTISHNGLLIFKPGEPQMNTRFRSSNDGGQHTSRPWYPTSDNLTTKYRQANVTARQFGPNHNTPDYSYIAGDITGAYNSTESSKVDEVTRSMVTLNLRNATYPGTLIVYDRVKSMNAAYKKTWLLHSIQKPTVSGNTITIVRDRDGYSGKLVTESLLPTGKTFTKLGQPNRDFWVEDSNTNYKVVASDPKAEPGAWRVEVSPSTDRRQDYFLNVMTVMDASQASGPAVKMIDASKVTGVRLLDRAVIFGKSSTPMTGTAFSVPGNGVTKILVCDLQPGLWDVARNGQTVATGLHATTDGKCIYFQHDTSTPGQSPQYILTLQGPDLPARKSSQTKPLQP